MTDTVNLSPSHRGTPRENAVTFKRAGLSDGWIVPGDDTLISTFRDDVADGPHNEFAHINTSGHTVTFDTGEAVVEGAPLCRDVTTDVTLNSNTAGQTVYLGWAHNSNDTVRIGLASAFNADDARIPIYEFDTDSTTVTSTTDHRNIGHIIDVENQYYQRNSVAEAENVSSTVGGVAINNYARTDRNVEIFEGSVRMRDDQSLLNSEGTSTVRWRLRGDASRYTIPSDMDDFSWPSVIEVPRLLTVTDEHDEAILDIHTNYGLRLNRSMNFRGHQAEGMRIENRDNRPSNPQPGRIIFRTDK